jgi:starch phosphorylase
VFADFAAYRDCQRTVAADYRDRERWTRMSILNSARTGKFSSDRTIREYCRDIWRVEPVRIKRGAAEDTSADLDCATGARRPLVAAL